MNPDVKSSSYVFTDNTLSGSGQGASMALEDCEILATLLAHHQDQDQSSWRVAAKLYSDMRIPRLRWIRREADKRSGMKQDMGVVQEMVMYFFIWLGCEYTLFKYRKFTLTDTPRRQDWVCCKTIPEIWCIRCARGGQEGID